MRQTFLTEDGTRLSYLDEGQGVPVLALAGLTRDGADFDYLSDHLAPCRLIRLDARGRGQSAWADWQSYTILQETQDALALLDHLQLESCAVIGTSRGGFIGMMIAATARHRVSGLCLVDVGPVLERKGLERIAKYVGVAPGAKSLADIANRLPDAMPGFDNVPATRWMEEAERHFTLSKGDVTLTYDPDLRLALDEAMAAPPVDLWPLFDACAGLPLALVRGAGSDVLSREAADEMQRRRPDLMRAEVPGRGHVPFLDEPMAVDVINRWLVRLPIDAVEQEDTGL